MLKQLSSPSNRDTLVVDIANTDGGDDSFHNGEAAYKQSNEDLCEETEEGNEAIDNGDTSSLV
ncbi:hypothetical protein IFM47457_07674 [Aspergillus lentulus]|nr:hypothetical protein IFM47457_07674 [Aspergillus lentulus]